MGWDIWSTFTAIAAARPGHPALIRDDEMVSFAELHASAAGAAAELAAAGLVRGDCCVIWAENAPELASALLGVLALGAIPSMVNADAPLSHFQHAGRTVGARLAVIDEPRFDAAEFHGTRLRLENLGGLARDCVPGRPPAAVHAAEPASIFFTSGSTGPPKGVTQSHANLIWGCEAVAQCLGLRADDRILCAIPWAFDYGWGQLLSTLLLGVTQVIPGARNPFSICAAIEQHRPTVLPCVPSMLANLIRGVSPIRDIDLGSIRVVTNTGSKIPETLFPEVADLFAHAEISLNYGLTETYRSASLPAALARAHPTSVGRAIPGVSLAVMRDDGSEAAPGEEGEVVHRGAGVFLGYWGEPEKTAQVRRPDPLWRHAGIAAPMAVFTGDLGWRDADGLLYIRGRRDRQIKSMGVRVSPDEIESLVHRTNLVAEVAVLSRPHEMMGEMVIAAVVPLRPGENPTRALQKAARTTMSPFMRPMEWNLVDALPRTPNGKVDYPALKRRFAREEEPA
jgi:acyl-coenzyme A synthetase/AMP-(fatty) acid ligase